MRFDNWAGGKAEVELTSASLEETLDAFVAADIPLENLLRQTVLTCTVVLPGGKLRTAELICRKRGDTLRIRKRWGISRTVRKLLARPVILLGAAVLGCLTLLLPTRVLFVQVDGNAAVPEKRILEAAETCGIAFGASRREVRSERVKNALLEAVPELSWAGVNTSGCTATISVREKDDTQRSVPDHGAASILASRDAYILSATATAGNLLVRPGESVHQGQVLISAYTDCGLCIRAERAEGEILAQTNRKMDAVMPSSVLQKTQDRVVKRKISLLLRKKRIILWKDSGIWEGSCGRMYEEYYITLPGGFRLPFALCIETYTLCQTQAQEIPPEEAEGKLKTFARDYLQRHMVAGKLLSAVETVEPETGRIRLTGEYVCSEMIGMIRQEQIGDTNGENS